MKNLFRRAALFAVVFLCGTVQHFLYHWFPCPVAALIAPVSESIWEHIKLLYWPLLLCSCLHRETVPYLRTMLLVCFAMLTAGSLYHILLNGDALIVDLILYAALLWCGLFKPIGDMKHSRTICGHSAALGLLIVVFTFSPPSIPLFQTM